MQYGTIFIFIPYAQRLTVKGSIHLTLKIHIGSEQFVTYDMNILNHASVFWSPVSATRGPLTQNVISYIITLITCFTYLKINAKYNVNPIVNKNKNVRNQLKIRL